MDNTEFTTTRAAGDPPTAPGHPKSCRSPLRVHFSSQANMATFRLWTIHDSHSARAPRRARALCEFCVVHNRFHTYKPMLTSKSIRAPLRVHFSFQVNMATFRLCTIHDSQSARAREEFCVAHIRFHTHKPMLNSKSGRAPLRVHCSFQVNTATFRLWTIHDSQSARARSSVLPITNSIHTNPC